MGKWQKIKSALDEEKISIQMYPKTYTTVAVALGLIVTMFIVALW